MWAIIKKALNSTLGTSKFQPLDVLIEDVVNDGDIPLNELLFGNKKIEANNDNIYCLIDSFVVPANKTVESAKRLFIHAKGTVTFKNNETYVIVYKNGILQNSSSNISVSCHDYFDFKVENTTNNDITAIITMRAKEVE